MIFTVILSFQAGFTALHLAAQNGHNQSARALLYAGCTPDCKNNVSQTPAASMERHVICFRCMYFVVVWRHAAAHGSTVRPRRRHAHPDFSQVSSERTEQERRHRSAHRCCTQAQEGRQAACRVQHQHRHQEQGLHSEEELLCIWMIG